MKMEKLNLPNLEDILEILLFWFGKLSTKNDRKKNFSKNLSFFEVKKDLSRYAKSALERFGKDRATNKVAIGIVVFDFALEFQFG